MSDKKERDFENPAETRSNTPFKPPSVPSTSATTSTWSRFKDPRVVRVSRALGGKDRHSKVCTVRGLRDRRVRLSVPTAIQLYDLQERLGLNQPSKVVDWLLNAAKREIDQLPPLQIPQGMFNFSNNNHQHGSNYNLDQPMLNFQDFASGSQLPDKQGLKVGSAHGDHGDEDWANNNNNSVSSSSYNSIFRLDPSNLTLSHTPRAGHVSAQHEDWHSFGLLPSQPTLSTVPPGPHQVLVYHQQGAGIMSTQHEVNNFQRSQLSTSSFSSTIDSNSLPARQIHFNMTANLLPTQDHNGETET